ncbi:hypothetical protein CEXT_579321 [Caerostris extrusa]|uniref:Uncharacterized protein n=1 Tax=Caerostris extrusa TaxID=172846 RepID=A0AAV4XE98_CAEEX|nr:hypothetical protein CEXT_579321 [Caerostris extrusa]
MAPTGLEPEAYVPLSSVPVCYEFPERIVQSGFKNERSKRHSRKSFSRQIGTPSGPWLRDPSDGQAHPEIGTKSGDDPGVRERESAVTMETIDPPENPGPLTSVEGGGLGGCILHERIC